jgi:DNA invertase Pin-like site-specific DNA recombinase
MAVFAEFERAMIVERVRAGMARARAQGIHCGRPTISADKERHIVKLLRQGASIPKVMRQVGCGSGTVQRLRRAMISA